MRTVDYALEKDSINGGVELCGDTGIIKEYDGTVFVALVDGLGHGLKAHQAACLADDFFEQHYSESLENLLLGLHNSLEGTAGAVAGIGRLSVMTGTFSYAGIGNISARIYGNASRTLISKDGVIGYSIPNPREEDTTLLPGDILILSSDGIADHFLLQDYPGLLEGQAREIALRFLETLRKDDDASCLVLRYM